MSYLNTHARTVKPTSQDGFQPIGRTPVLNSIYMGFVKDSADIQKMGRLRVWIPEFGSAPEEKDGWIIVSYCSPFAGATNVYANNVSDIQSFEGTQTSYGMWMIPPDLNNQVLVMFINGDPARGVYIGSLYNQFMNHMVPGMSASRANYQHNGKPIPVAEYNKNNTNITDPDQALRPYQETKFKGLGNQGLITDPERGITNSSAQRESPSRVFGILTPGPAITETFPEQVHRKGGSSFIMDDEPTSEYIQFATKSGAQIRISETDGFVYIINRDGTGWIQIDHDGNIDVFAAANISLRAQRDFNIRADRNVNIEAGQNIFMKAAKDTTEETTPFTYNVNNVPDTKDIPVWAYKGDGKGEGGNIVMQALNNWHSTAEKNAYLTVVESDMNINVNNNLNVQTVKGGQNYNSKQGIMMTTDASVDIAATGNIRVGSKGSISIVGESDVIICSTAGISLNATDDIKLISASNILFTGMNWEMGSGDASFTGTLSVQGLTKLSGGLTAGGPVALGGSVPFVPADSASAGSNKPTPAEGAMSAQGSQLAEIKPLNDKVNILATWEDPDSKFKRRSQAELTTVSRFPTYEPCPEHEAFTISKISGYKPILSNSDTTYEGSSGAGNDATTAPPASTDPGSANVQIQGDPATDSIITKDLNLNALKNQLIVHEGLVRKSYLDTTNLLHGGIGHLLRANEIPLYPLGSPISNEQIDTWYTQDSLSAIRIAQYLVGDPWSGLSDIRRRAVIDLAFNMGLNRLSKFTRFFISLKALNFDQAGRELRDSIWYTQVGRRGPNIQIMIVQNIDPTGSDKKFPG
jgi:GH24 family phage-related lysozyme (muramidase)